MQALYAHPQCALPTAGPYNGHLHAGGSSMCQRSLWCTWGNMRAAPACGTQFRAKGVATASGDSGQRPHPRMSERVREQWQRWPA